LANFPKPPNAHRQGDFSSFSIFNKFHLTGNPPDFPRTFEVNFDPRQECRANLANQLYLAFSVLQERHSW
jgi:hypothetical protein